MSQIHILPFNPFQVNTHIIFDDTRECVIIDPACYEKQEEEQLSGFIRENGLVPTAILFTHCHIDHILGARFASRTYHLRPLTHKDSMGFLENSKEYGKVFGFDVKKPVLPDSFLDQGDMIQFGQQELMVLHAPGHAAGSLCFHNKKEGYVVVGDVLFSGGIGRTDLPTGDHDILIKSIFERLLSLPDETIVYPGHGPSTTIGEERRSNPFLTGIY
jgi:glyoxylase-like metal-dependent hydrolase (beta-lactamase superfamily II)